MDSVDFNSTLLKQLITIFIIIALVATTFLAILYKSFKK